MLKNYEESCSKIKHFIRLKSNNIYSYDNKYLKIRFDSDNDLFQEKHQKSLINDCNKQPPKVLLDERFY